MSAPRHSSPLAVDLETPCPILQSLSDVSEIKRPSSSSSRKAVFREVFPEPENELCTHCSHESQSDVEGEAIESSSKRAEVISQYVAKMREGIAKQGQRMEQVERKHSSTVEPSTENEHDSLDFHIKIVRKRKPAALLLNAKVHGNDLLSSMKSKATRVSFALPKKSETVQMLKDSEKRPKIRSTRKAPTSPGPLKMHPVRGVPLTPPSDSEAEQQAIEDDEETALLSIESSASSPMRSFNASHFYPPMVPSKSNHGHEYRSQKSRFRRSLDLSKKAVSRGAGGLNRIRDVLSPRRRSGGWSRLD